MIRVKHGVKQVTNRRESKRPFLFVLFCRPSKAPIAPHTYLYPWKSRTYLCSLSHHPWCGFTTISAFARFYVYRPFGVTLDGPALPLGLGHFGLRLVGDDLAAIRRGDLRFGRLRVAHPAHPAMVFRHLRPRLRAMDVATAPFPNLGLRGRGVGSLFRGRCGIGGSTTLGDPGLVVRGEGPFRRIESCPAGPWGRQSRCSFDWPD